jgi:ubiquinone/menaquinone biosynthesis C-methylase UbiE
MEMGLSEKEGARYWDKEAQGFNERVEQRLAKYDKLVEYIMTLAGPGKTDVVMEIGAGTGLVSSLLAPKVKKIIAVDISEAMLKIARARAAKAGVGNIEFVKGSFHKPNVAEKVDIIVTIDALHCTANGDYKKRAIEIMHDFLKDDGKVFLEDEMIVYDQEVLQKRFDQIVGYLDKLRVRSDREFQSMLFEERPDIHDLQEFFSEAIGYYMKGMAKSGHHLRLEDLVKYFEEAGFAVEATKRPSSTSGIIYAKKKSA